MTAVAEAEQLGARAGEAAEDAAHSRWLHGWARGGLVARGAIYMVVAVLAFQVARGHAHDRMDKQGALQAVVRQPLGGLLVVTLAVGFAGYAAWRLLEAVTGPTGEEDRRKAAAKRVGYLARAALYGWFFASAVKLVVWSKRASGDTAEVDWTARVLRWPGGTGLVAIVGVAIVVGGFYIGWRGLSRKFEKRLQRGEMSRAEHTWVVGFGAVGMVARMVVTTLVGGFLVTAALRHDPRQAVGIDGALRRLAETTVGPPLLFLLAAGLACYGLYSLAEARYRQVGAPARDGSRR
jgi:hypothetical protein